MNINAIKIKIELQCQEYVIHSLTKPFS